MTTFLVTLLIIFAFIYWLRQRVKRVVIKPVAKSGLIGPELLAEKTRLDILREWLRPIPQGDPQGLWAGGW